MKGVALRPRSRPTAGIRALLAIADRACVFAITEMMLGGDGSQPAHASDRAFTRIELGVMCALPRAAGAVARTWPSRRLPSRPLSIEGISDRIDFDVFGRKTQSEPSWRGCPCGCGRKRAKSSSSSPGAAIELMRQALGPIASEETKKADPRWSSQIQDKITRTSVGPDRRFSTSGLFRWRTSPTCRSGRSCSSARRRKLASASSATASRCCGASSASRTAPIRCAWRSRSIAMKSS